MSIDHHAFETRGKSLANSQFVALKALKKEDFPVRRSREREKRHAKGADKFRNSQKCKEPERRAKDERGRISRKLDNCTRSPWALVESLVFFSLFSRSAFFLSVPKCFVPEISFRSLLLSSSVRKTVGKKEPSPPRFGPRDQRLCRLCRQSRSVRRLL